MLPFIILSASWEWKQQNVILLEGRAHCHSQKCFSITFPLYHKPLLMKHADPKGKAGVFTKSNQANPGSTSFLKIPLHNQTHCLCFHYTISLPLPSKCLSMRQFYKTALKIILIFYQAPCDSSFHNKYLRWVPQKRGGWQLNSVISVCV